MVMYFDQVEAIVQTIDRAAIESMTDGPRRFTQFGLEFDRSGA